MTLKIHVRYYLLGLLHEICVTLISHILVVLVEVENVKARVAVSVAKLPMSIYTVEEKISC
jgi:hypothetical protein